MMLELYRYVWRDQMYEDSIVMLVANNPEEADKLLVEFIENQEPSTGVLNTRLEYPDAESGLSIEVFDITKPAVLTGYIDFLD